MASFGPLEWRVLEALWRRARPSTVRELQPLVPAVAYTTLMTTLQRLFTKGVLDREKRARAFVYAPKQSRSELETALATAALRDAIGRNPDAIRPLLSLLVDLADTHDPALLDELESLVRARQAEDKAR